MGWLSFQFGSIARSMCLTPVWGTYSTVIYQSAEPLQAQATSLAVFAAVLASEVTAVG